MLYDVHLQHKDVQHKDDFDFDDVITAGTRKDKEEVVLVNANMMQGRPWQDFSKDCETGETKVMF